MQEASIINNDHPYNYKTLLVEFGRVGHLESLLESITKQWYKQYHCSISVNSFSRGRNSIAVLLHLRSSIRQ